MCKQQFVVYNHLVRILYLIFGCEALLKLEPSHSLWILINCEIIDTMIMMMAMMMIMMRVSEESHPFDALALTVLCIAMPLCMFACKLKYNSNELSNHKRFTLQNWFENHHNQNEVYVLQYMHRGIWFLMIAAAAAKTKQKILSQTHILLSLFESANTIQRMLLGGFDNRICFFDWNCNCDCERKALDLRPRFKSLMVVGCQSNCVMLYNYVYWAEESSILGLSVIDVG